MRLLPRLRNGAYLSIVKAWFMETKGKQLEFKESVYNMEDGSEIAYL